MRVDVSGLELEVEVSGPHDGAPLLMISGMGQQLTGWRPGLLGGLRGRGHRVIAYDHRDVGLSDSPVVESEPDFGAILGGDHSTVPYTLEDLAADAVGVLDALELPTAHVLGHSLGGGVAQRLAVEHPERVATLTLWGTSPGDGSGEMEPEVLEVLITPVTDDRAHNLERAANISRMAWAPVVVDESMVREAAESNVDRWTSATSGPHQIAAALAGGNYADRVAALEVPTLVIHGTGDRFVGVSGGRALGSLIADSKLVEIPGMGHGAIADEHVTQIVDAVAAHTHG